MSNFKKSNIEMQNANQIDYKLLSDKLIDAILATMNEHGQLVMVDEQLTPESRQIFTNSLKQIFESLKRP